MLLDKYSQDFCFQESTGGGLFGTLHMNQISFTFKTEEVPVLVPVGSGQGFSKWSKTSKNLKAFTCHPCTEKHLLLSSRIVRVSTKKRRNTEFETYRCMTVLNL